jgi:hypothetical protein
VDIKAIISQNTIYYGLLNQCHKFFKFNHFPKAYDTLRPNVQHHKDNGQDNRQFPTSNMPKFLGQESRKLKATNCGFILVIESVDKPSWIDNKILSFKHYPSSIQLKAPYSSNLSCKVSP